jgi:hypothetical protein
MDALGHPLEELGGALIVLAGVEAGIVDTLYGFVSIHTLLR